MTSPTTSPLKRLRGLKNLVQDAVVGTSRAIEHVQLETAARPFGILEQVPPLTEPVKGIHAIHDAMVGASHGMVRMWTQVVGTSLDVVLDVAESVTGQRKEPADHTESHTVSKGSAPPA